MGEALRQIVIFLLVKRLAINGDIMYLAAYSFFPQCSEKHISVDILPDRLTGKARSLLMITVYSVVVAVAIQFLIAGILAVRYYHEMGFETHTEFIFNLWVTYLPFPIGFGLLILFAL